MSRGRRPDPPGVASQKAAVRSTKTPPATAPVEAEAQGVESNLRCPLPLKGRAREIWDRWAPRLKQARLLTQTDELAFARYCRNFAKWEQLRDGLDRKGYSYNATTTNGGKLRRADPDFLIADRLERMLMAAEDRFGLNPSERQRIMAARANAPAGDLFADRPRPADPATPAADAAQTVSGPIGLLN